jgi:HSP20 family protein
MAIVRWDPWRELAAFERQFDEMFGRQGGRAETGGRRMNAWTPAVDMRQDGDTMVVCADLAGVPPDKVEITVDDNVLTISGNRDEDKSVEEGSWVRRERYVGQFQRSISLPPGIDPKGITASADNGVIEVRIPRPKSAEPHRVQLGQGTKKGQGALDVDVKEKGEERQSQERQTQERQTQERQTQAASSDDKSKSRKAS